MILCREELIILEKLIPLQTRIYPDACDIGIRIDAGRNQAAREMLRAAMIGLNEAGLLERQDGPQGVDIRTWQYFQPIEKDGDTTHGNEIRIGYHYDVRRSYIFLSIEISAAFR